MNLRRDVTGKQFGRLIAQWPAGRKLIGKSTPRFMWLCSCVCGKLAIVSIANLQNGMTKSCGCLHDETSPQNAKKIHGQVHRGKCTPEYRSYRSAKNRCTNPNNDHWQDYGGRGIEFRFTSFKEFFEELGSRPPGKSLDRINNNGHYEKGNVRWATPVEQCNNRRRPCRNQRS